MLLVIALSVLMGVSLRWVSTLTSEEQNGFFVRRFRCHFRFSPVENVIKNFFLFVADAQTIESHILLVENVI
jgi:hypothetical protein